jgi:hypothetical protein
MPWPLALALLRAGSNIAARMAMIAITTSNSINVNPLPVVTTAFDPGVVDRFIVKERRARVQKTFLFDSSRDCSEPSPLAICFPYFPRSYLR